MPTSRLPRWVKHPQTDWTALHEMKTGLRRLGLLTVCESARCPNIHECFGRGAATFMILGDTCMRGCGFCAVPQGRPGPLDQREPENVARMAAAMELRYVVLTSVTRDDLPDGGAAHWAETVRAVRQRLPELRIEVLTPDFGGSREAIATVAAAAPDVFNHNVETVPPLYEKVRPRARYGRSLELLATVRQIASAIPTKSGLMVGLGETRQEVEQVLRDLRAVDCNVVTIGQYLQPRRRNLPVAEYVAPEVFDHYREYGLNLGFKAVFSGPMVRSSYMAETVFRKIEEEFHTKTRRHEDTKKA